MARRSALSISLLALAASLFAVPSAHAGLKLPAGADLPPKLPPGVVPASSAPRPLDAGPHSGAMASASAARTVFRLHEGPPPLWATVNICDTERWPNALGVRTSVPGDGSGVGDVEVGAVQRNGVGQQRSERPAELAACAEDRDVHGSRSV